MACQSGSRIVPGWVFPIAAACANVTVPKFVNGSTRQRFPEPQTEGASAIHSAELTSSGCAVVIVLLKRVLRVTSFRLIVTRCPETTTAAVIVSPGLIFSLTGTTAAGTISHQAL